MIDFQLQRLHADAIMPTRGTPLSLGLDLHSLIVQEDGRPSKVMIPPRTSRVIHTGWAIRPPQPNSLRENSVWLPAVCSRGGLALRGLWVTNAPGIIDPDYRGEILVILYNGNMQTHWVQHTDRVAQLVAIQASMSGVVLVSDVIEEPTSRGVRALGSTGQ